MCGPCHCVLPHGLTALGRASRDCRFESRVSGCGPVSPTLTPATRCPSSPRCPQAREVWVALQRHLAEGKVGAAGGPLGGSRENETPTPGPCSPDGLGGAGVDTRRPQPGEGLWPQRQASFIPSLEPQFLVWEVGCPPFLPRMALSSAKVTTDRCCCHRLLGDSPRAPWGNPLPPPKTCQARPRGPHPLSTLRVGWCRPGSQATSPARL